MKILVDGMPASIGGIGTLLLNMANKSRSVEDGLIFEFLVPENSQYIEILEREGYTYYIVPRLVHLFSYLVCLQKIVKKNHYDYLWFNNTSKVNFVLPFYLKYRGNAKVIAHPHGVNSEATGIKRIFYNALEGLYSRVFLSMIDVPFACSKEAGDRYYRDSKELKDGCKVIHNGIDTKKFQFTFENRQDMRETLGIHSTDILIGSIGRLTNVKNYTFLIKLLAELPEQYKLILIGDGPEREMLSEQIENYQLTTRCFLLGKQDNVERFLSAMDIYALPSLHEGMPFSIVEAQANGLYCIVSDTVSQEVVLTPYVHFCTLNQVEEWKQTVLTAKLNRLEDRKVAFSTIDELGYDLSTSYHLFIDSIVERV